MTKGKLSERTTPRKKKFFQEKKDSNYIFSLKAAAARKGESTLDHEHDINNSDVVSNTNDNNSTAFIFIL